MAEVVAAQPIPIRLAYRYPNGCMISYSARATGREDDAVRVIVNEEFEEGITLSVIAPFLDGLTTARVHSVKRSRKNPGYFEVILRIGEEGVAGHGSGGGGDGLTAAENGIAADDGPVVSEVRGAKPKNAVAVPDQAIEAAEKLAYELSKLPARNLSKVFQEIPSEMRFMSLLVAIAAVIHLLQTKGHVEVRRVIGNAREARKK